MRSVAVLLLLLPLAGCLADDFSNDGSQSLVIDRESLDHPLVVPPPRTTQVTIPMQEGFRGDSDVGVDWLTMTNDRPEQRDVDLEYAGVQLAFDEWGRAIESFVFRFKGWTVEVDEVDFTADGLRGSAHWEEVEREFLFDVTDGRFIGQVNLERQSRSFVDARHRDPFTYTDWMPMFLMVHHVLGGDMDGRIPVTGGEMYFERDRDTRPLPGDCDVYKIRFAPDEPVVVDASEPVEDISGDGAFVCVGAGNIPLWTYSHYTTDNGVIEEWLERKGDPFAMPGFLGEPLEPRVFPRYPMEPVSALPIDVLLDPIWAPPSQDPTDWSGRLHDRLAALQLNPFFLQYRLTHEDLYLHQAVTGWPDATTFLLDELLGLDVPFIADEESWMMVTPGEGFYWGFVDSRIGETREEDDGHSSHRQGFEFPPGTIDYPPLDELPELIKPGELVPAYGYIAPEHPASLTFLVWPEFENVDLGDRAVSWYALDGCLNPEPDEEPRFAIASGITGQLAAAGIVQLSENGCSAGGAWLKTPGGGSLWMASGHDGLPQGLYDLRPGRGSVMLSP